MIQSHVGSSGLVDETVQGVITLESLGQTFRFAGRYEQRLNRIRWNGDGLSTRQPKLYGVVIPVNYFRRDVIAADESDLPQRTVRPRDAQAMRQIEGPPHDKLLGVRADRSENAVEKKTSRRGELTALVFTLRGRANFLRSHRY